MGTQTPPLPVGEGATISYRAFALLWELTSLEPERDVTLYPPRLPKEGLGSPLIMPS